MRDANATRMLYEQPGEGPRSNDLNLTRTAPLSNEVRGSLQPVLQLHQKTAGLQQLNLRTSLK